MRTFGAVLFACALSVFSIPAARAEAAGPSAEAKEQARSLLDLGDAKMKDKRYQEALDAYQAADKIMGVPTTGTAVAQAYIALGKLVEAHDLLLRVSRYEAPKDNTAYITAQREAADLAAAIAPRIPTITVKLSDKGVAGLKVVVDEQLVESAGLGFPMPVDAGDHVIAAGAPGYLDAKAIVHVDEKEHKDVPLELKKDPNYKPPPPAALAPVQPPLGTRAELARELPAPDPSALRHASEWRGLAYAGYAIGAVGLVGGGVTGGLALAKKSSLSKTCNPLCGVSQQSDINALSTLSTASTALFVVGGVGVAAGVLGTALAIAVKPVASPKTGVALRLCLGPASAGVEGTF